MNTQRIAPQHDDVTGKFSPDMCAAQMKAIAEVVARLDAEADAARDRAHAARRATFHPDETRDFCISADVLASDSVQALLQLWIDVDGVRPGEAVGRLARILNVYGNGGSK